MGEDIEKALKGMLEPTFEEVVIGQVKLEIHLKQVKLEQSQDVM